MRENARRAADGYRLQVADDVWAIPEPERGTRATFNTDLCQLGERFFIRGVLRVPLRGRDEDFGWGVWAEVDGRDFLRYMEIYNVDASNEPAQHGALANRISAYEDAAGERLTIRFGNSATRPEFFVEAGSASSLARDQEQGMDDERYHEILSTLGAT